MIPIFSRYGSAGPPTWVPLGRMPGTHRAVRRAGCPGLLPQRAKVLSEGPRGTGADPPRSGRALASMSTRASVTSGGSWGRTRLAWGKRRGALTTVTPAGGHQPCDQPPTDVVPRRGRFRVDARKPIRPRDCLWIVWISTVNSASTLRPLRQWPLASHIVPTGPPRSHCQPGSSKPSPLLTFAWGSSSDDGGDVR